jgi:hypothetical protein
MMDRENFDFVSMENYSADMADLSNVAGNAIAKLRRDKDEMLKVIAALVEASGGKIAVPLHILARMDFNNTELIIEENDCRMERVFRVRAISRNQNGG